MITATELQVRAGAQLLLDSSSVRVGTGDRIGLVGRNGAGKTTTMRVLAGETPPHAGRVDVVGDVGYLPQDPRTGDLSTTARDRVLSARGLDRLVTQIAKLQIALAETPDDSALLERYGDLEERFADLGGYAAESDAARICANLGLAAHILGQRLDTLSGGQRRRVELARLLFADSAGQSTTLLLDEPTNHLDVDSIAWLRDFLCAHTGGLVVVSHDAGLLESVVNKVWYLDSNRTTIDVYNLNWSAYLAQRASDEHRRERERVNSERTIESLRQQAAKMRATASKARAAHQMLSRADSLAAALDDVRAIDKVARLRFPTPSSCGRTPLSAEGLSKSYGSLEVFAEVNLAVDRGARVVVLGLNGAGKTTLLRLLAGLEPPDTGRVIGGHGLRLGYYAQEHETLDHDRTVLENMRTSASRVGRSDLTDTDLRKILGGFLFSGDDAAKPAGVLSGGEKTRLALAMLVTSAANVLLLDEPTNNLDPLSREQVLDALRRYSGAIILVTHDAGAVAALSPDKVILLPDGIEDTWHPDLSDLITLA
jgi:ATPase subunit of ABC transporter with duplicated ATPase domains